LCLVAVTWSQADPDPNSPSPVLLGFSDTVRRPILPKRPLSRKQAILIDEPPQLDSDLKGEAESKLNVYISSVPLSSGEDFSAFRVYARDPDGRLYRFPTLSLQAADFSKDVYVLTVSTKDELNYWDP